MKKLLVVGVIVLFIGMTISSTGYNLEQQSTIVTIDGNTLYVGGTGTGNYSKIQDAIDNASNGDTVFVYDDSSPYYENLEVDKRINLIGKNRDTTVIDGNNKTDVIRITSDWVNISGFMIKNSGIYGEEYGGITIRTNFNTITGNNIISNMIGINLRFSTNNNITGNTISLNDMDGINLWDESNSNTITSNNIASNNEEGINIHGSNNVIMGNTITLSYSGGIVLRGESNTITGNTITSNNWNGICFTFSSSMNNLSLNTITNNNASGIRLSESHNNSIFKNTILRNRYSGIVIGSSYDIIIEKNIISETFEDDHNGEGIVLINSWNTSISNNYISDNVNGIIFIKSSSNQIFHNVITNNTRYGINFWSFASSNNIIFRNSITDNKFGIKLTNSSNNKINSNNFIRNQRQAKFIGCKNTWEANYWNRMRFLPKLIFGRLGMHGLSYDIPWINIDWRPASEPYDIGV